jgi:hypothetical protein
MSTPTPENARRIGRILVLSATLMFAFSLAVFNDLVPLGLPGDTRTILGGLLFVVGLSELGLAIYFLRRFR